MQRLFLAGILILVGTSAISAQQSNFGFGTFCHKVCRYEVKSERCWIFWFGPRPLKIFD